MARRPGVLVGVTTLLILFCYFFGRSEFVARSSYFKGVRVAFQSYFRRHVYQASSSTPFCCTDARKLAVSKGVYLLDAKLGAKCAVTGTDDMFVLKCRLRQQKNALLASSSTPESTLQPGEGHSSHTHTHGTSSPSSRLVCPTDIVASLEVRSKPEVEKYKQRSEEAEGRCMGLGMWGLDWTLAHKCVVVWVAEKFQMQPGDLVLDWGCGCGHKLSLLKQLFDVDGFGLDFTQGAIEWANKHSLGTFCTGDGRKMQWLPSDHFDHIISFAALYHLAVASEQCGVIREMYRVVKPGGNIFVGWMGTHQALPVDTWYQCGLPVEARVEVLSEKGLYPAVFKDSDFDLFDWGQQTVQGIENSSYAIFVHKPASLPSFSTSSVHFGSGYGGAKGHRHAHGHGHEGGSANADLPRRPRV